MKIVGAMIARNEAGPDRYLRAALQNMGRWCDPVILLDDHSDDDTASVAKEEGAVVVEREGGQQMWGHESAAREELWNVAVRFAAPDKAWVLFQDADMLLSADPRPLLLTEELNTWLWRLYDVWDARSLYRADGYWQGHLSPRPWLVNPHRVPDGWRAVWNDRGLHCGHLPVNWPMRAGVAPEQYYFEHLAYLTPEHRKRKHAQYMREGSQLTPFERDHAQSILDS